MHRATVVIEADETGGYYAFCPSLPGCYSQGDTLEDTKANITEAIQCHLESLLKEGEPLPQEREEFIGTIQVPLPTAHGR
jgi:predicted RNase H-like HicB family nuclease